MSILSETNIHSVLSKSSVPPSIFILQNIFSVDRSRFPWNFFLLSFCTIDLTSWKSSCPVTFTLAYGVSNGAVVGAAFLFTISHSASLLSNWSLITIRSILLVLGRLRKVLQSLLVHNVQLFAHEEFLKNSASCICQCVMPRGRSGIAIHCYEDSRSLGMLC